MTKGHPSEIDLGFLTSLLTLRVQTPNLYGFLNYFSLRNFWATSCCVLNLRLNPSNYELNFGSNKPNICYVDELVCYCGSNKYSEVGCFLSKFFNPIQDGEKREGERGKAAPLPYSGPAITYLNVGISSPRSSDFEF